MKGLTRTLDILEKILRVFVSFFFVTMVVSIAYQITLRYVFSKANAWSEELARYTFVWLVMLASALAARRGRHMCIESLIEKFPHFLRRTLEYSTRVLAIAFFSVLGVKGIELVRLTARQLSTGLDISMSYVYMAIPVGAFLMILFTVEDILCLRAFGSGRFRKELQKDA